MQKKVILIAALAVGAQAAGCALTKAPESSPVLHLQEEKADSDAGAEESAPTGAAAPTGTEAPTQLESGSGADDSDEELDGAGREEARELRVTGDSKTGGSEGDSEADGSGKKKMKPTSPLPGQGAKLVCDVDCQKHCKKTDPDAGRCVVQYHNGCLEGGTPKDGVDCSELEGPSGVQAQAVPQIDWP